MLCDETMGAANRWAAGASGKAGSPAELSTFISLHQGDNVGKTMQNAADSMQFTETYFNACFGSQPGIATDLFSGGLGCRADVGLASRFLSVTSSRQRNEPKWYNGADSGARTSRLAAASHCPLPPRARPVPGRGRRG